MSPEEQFIGICDSDLEELRKFAEFLGHRDDWKKGRAVPVLGASNPTLDAIVAEQRRRAESLGDANDRSHGEDES
jgi:hypothetical protein